MKVGTQGSVLRSIQTLFSVGSVGGMTDGELLENSSRGGTRGRGGVRRLGGAPRPYGLARLPECFA